MAALPRRISGEITAASKPEEMHGQSARTSVSQWSGSWCAQAAGCCSILAAGTQFRAAQLWDLYAVDAGQSLLVKYGFSCQMK